MGAWHHVLLVALGLSIVCSGAAQDVSLGGLPVAEPMSVGTQMQGLNVFPASPVAGDTIYITGRLVRCLQLLHCADRIPPWGRRTRLCSQPFQISAAGSGIVG